MKFIGLTSKKKTKLAKKTKKIVTVFSTLRPTEKDKLILECFTKLQQVLTHSMEQSWLKELT